jgi:hypothetical protein
VTRECCHLPSVDISSDPRMLTLGPLALVHHSFGPLLQRTIDSISTCLRPLVWVGSITPAAQGSSRKANFRTPSRFPRSRSPTAASFNRTPEASGDLIVGVPAAAATLVSDPYLATMLTEDLGDGLFGEFSWREPVLIVPFATCTAWPMWSVRAVCEWCGEPTFDFVDRPDGFFRRYLCCRGIHRW